jgi:predicted RNA-binding protein
MFWRRNMCEHNAYIKEGDGEILFLQAVDAIDWRDGKLYLKSVSGEERYFNGEIAEINLCNHRIVLQRKQFIPGENVL